MAIFRCFEWSFFNIYITDNLLLSQHVAMWRPLAHLWDDDDSDDQPYQNQDESDKMDESDCDDPKMLSILSEE